MRLFLENRQTLGIYFFMAMAEAIGAFLLLCGCFHLTISQIGRIASAGYVLGMGGVFFGVMILFKVRESLKHA